VENGKADKGAAAAEGGRKSPAAAANRDRSPPPTKLHVSKLTRNVTAEHVSEIFSIYGTLVSCTLAMDPKVQLPKGFAVVEFANAEEAEKAKDYMDGAQLDGNVLQ
jgi:RNA-binding protein with serine-rich domain 1